MTQWPASLIRLWNYHSDCEGDVHESGEASSSTIPLLARTDPPVLISTMPKANSSAVLGAVFRSKFGPLRVR